MPSIGDYARGAADLLMPDGNTERLTFKRFKGSDILEAAEQETPAENIKPTESITLKVNPETISYSKPKITQKVQTSAPGRFVVFDWGTDLEVITINGNTGNLLPTVIQSGYDPNQPIINSIINKVQPGAEIGPLGAGQIPGVDVSSLHDAMMGKLSYFELIGMSPKYRTFSRLEKMFDLFDADRDILTLEIGEEILRLYLNEFSFEQTAESPWNWKYTISVTNLRNLTDNKTREEDEIPNNELVSKGV